MARGGDGALKEGITRADSKDNGNVMLDAFGVLYIRVLGLLTRLC